VPLRPIRTESELDEAINMANYLIDRPQMNADEKDYLAVLGGLIEEYETEHIVFPRRPPSAILGHLIEAKGVTQAQAAKDCRIAASTISELLAGTRKMNRNHIAKFAAYFHVGPGVFFEEN
jgi:HTH-type transcriptional regulator / antitoxin HigA